MRTRPTVSAIAGLSVLLVLAIACYAVALPGPYQFDDHITVAIDPGAASLSAWWSDVGAHVRPLLKGSFALSHPIGQFFGNVPLGHRLVNLAIHLAVIVACFRLSMQFISTCASRVETSDARLAALFAAALFGLHPFATEAVSYVSGRSTSLGTLLVCVSISTWIDARQRGTTVQFVLSVLAGLTAALTRETAALSLPLLILAWEFMRCDRPVHDAPSLRQLTLATLPFVALACAVTIWMLLHDRYARLLQMSAWIMSVRPAAASLLTALAYFAESFFLARYPNIDPAVDASGIDFGARAFGSLVLATLLWLVWHQRTTRPHWMLGACWVLAWLLPLYAMPIRHDAIAERHLYPVLWGLAFPIAVELAPHLRGPITSAWLARATSVAVLVVLAAVTTVRNSDYRSEVTLWEAARRGAPDKPRVLNNLGAAYMEAGRWDEAAAVLTRAVELNPDDTTVRWNARAATARDLGVLSQPAFIPR